MEEKEIEMIKKFYKKIATVRDNMDRIPKNGYNNFHKYHYATEDDVTTFLRKQLSENNLVTSVSCKNSEIILNEGGKKESTLTRVELEFKIIDLKTGYYECFPFDGVGEDKGDKGIYKAYTGAVKYFLMKFFLVSTGDDVEKEDISYNNKDVAKLEDEKKMKAKIDSLSEETKEGLRNLGYGLKAAYIFCNKPELDWDDRKILVEINKIADMKAAKE